MKIVLVITNSRRKNLVFASDASKNKIPHPNPEPNERGLQITEEFYPLAKKWLQ